MNANQLQADLFAYLLPAPALRTKPRVLMHVCDAGDAQCCAAEDPGKPMCRMRCTRCGAESGWIIFNTVTEAKRGIPCASCNP